MRSIAIAAALLAATPALCADAWSAMSAATDYANTGFMAARCGGSPWSRERRDASLGLALSYATGDVLLRDRRAVIERRGREEGIERVCAALRSAYGVSP